MTATAFDPHALIAKSRLGVLATIKSNGLPQLSPVTPFYDQGAGVIYVSMTEGRAKTANLRRDPRAALEVTSPDGWAWATAEGTVTLTGPGWESWGVPFDLIVARTPSRLSASSMRGSNGVAVMPLANSQSRVGYSHSPFARARVRRVTLR